MISQNSDLKIFRDASMAANPSPKQWKISHLVACLPTVFALFVRSCQQVWNHLLTVVTSLLTLCDVTLSVYPHRAGLKNMPGHGGIRTYDLCNPRIPPWSGIFFKPARCGYTLRVTSHSILFTWVHYTNTANIILVDIIRFVARLFQQVQYSDEITILGMGDIKKIISRLLLRKLSRYSIISR
jgi:hypothetical protein